MDEQQQSSQLRKIISEQFNKAEIRLLCSDLGVEYENLSGDTRDEQALSGSMGIQGIHPYVGMK